MRYLEDVRAIFLGNKEKYHEFIRLMNDYKDRMLRILAVGFSIDVAVTVARVKEMFRGHADLILGFNKFLPKEHETNLHAKKKPLEFDDALRFLNKIKVSFKANVEVYDSFVDLLFMYDSRRIHIMGLIMKVKELFRGHTDLIQSFNAFLPPELEIKAEFDEAMSYVKKVKNRFRNDEQIYEEFLGILEMHRKDEKSAEEVRHNVANLFGGHNDLLEEFLYFSPISSASNGNIL